MFSIEERKYYVESVLKRVFVFNKEEFDKNFSMEKDVISYLINNATNEFLDKNKFLFGMIVNYINNNPDPSKNDLQMILPLKQFLKLVQIEMEKDLNYKIEIKEEIKEEDKFKPINELGNIVEEKEDLILKKIEEKEEIKKSNSPSDKIASLLAKVKDGGINKDVIKEKIENLESSQVEEKKSTLNVLKDGIKIGTDSISKLINKKENSNEEIISENNVDINNSKLEKEDIKEKLNPINIMENIIKIDIPIDNNIDDIPDYLLEDSDFQENIIETIEENTIETIEEDIKEDIKEEENLDLSNLSFDDYQDDYQQIDLLDYSNDDEEELNFDEELYFEENIEETIEETIEEEKLPEEILENVNTKIILKIDEKEKEEIKLNYTLKELEDENIFNESIKNLNKIELDEYNDPIINVKEEEIISLSEDEITDKEVDEILKKHGFEEEEEKEENNFNIDHITLNSENTEENKEMNLVFDAIEEEKPKELSLDFLFGEEEKNTNKDLKIDNDLFNNITEEKKEINLVFDAIEEDKPKELSLDFLFGEQKKEKEIILNFDEKIEENNIGNISLNNVIEEKKIENNQFNNLFSKEEVEDIIKENDKKLENELIITIDKELTENEKLLFRIKELERKVSVIEKLEKRIEELEKIGIRLS